MKRKITFSTKSSLESRAGGGAKKLETGFHPTSKSTIRRVARVQEATRKKPLQGLDNTAAKRTDGKDFLQIIDELERVVAEKEEREVPKRLQESKLYLKITYRSHCKMDDNKCADHCGVFALSDVVVTRTFRNYAKMEEMIS